MKFERDATKCFPSGAKLTSETLSDVSVNALISPETVASYRQLRTEASLQAVKKTFPSLSACFRDILQFGPSVRRFNVFPSYERKYICCQPVSKLLAIYNPLSVKSIPSIQSSQVLYSS